MARSQSQCIAQCLIDSFHSRHPPDGPSDKLQFYRSQVVGHDYGIGFQAGLESEWVLQQDRDPTGMSGAGQIAADHGNDYLRESGVEFLGLDHQNRP